MMQHKPEGLLNFLNRRWTAKGLLFACVLGALFPLLALADYLGWNFSFRHQVEGEWEPWSTCWRARI